jgi:hypothetical protein
MTTKEAGLLPWTQTGHRPLTAWTAFTGPEEQLYAEIVLLMGMWDGEDAVRR